MNFRNISAWSIRNPIPPIVLFVALTLAGLISFVRMDVQNDPDIVSPGALVLISQPGAAPTEMETQVTQTVEAAIRINEGIDEINSMLKERSPETISRFAHGPPIARDVTDARNATTPLRGELPHGPDEPKVTQL